MDLVKDFLHYLAADRGCSPLTVRSYADALTGFLHYYSQLDEGLTWETVDADIVRRWMADRMQAGTQPQTVRRALSALRSFYHYLHMMGYTTLHPMQRVQNPKVPRRLPAFLKEAEMNRLLDDVPFPDNRRGRRDYLMLLTFYTTGVRVSELVALDYNDVSTARGELKVTGKRNKQRVVPFGKELSEAFTCFAAEDSPDGQWPSGPVFRNGRGGRLTAAEARRVVRRYLSLVTPQQKRSPHVLRHTFATVMLNNGADLEAVKDLLGHESLATTEVYTHTTFSELKRAYAQAHPRAAHCGNDREGEGEKKKMN